MAVFSSVRPTSASAQNSEFEVFPIFVIFFMVLLQRSPNQKTASSSTTFNASAVMLVHRTWIQKPDLLHKMNLSLSFPSVDHEKHWESPFFMVPRLVFFVRAFVIWNSLLIYLDTQFLISPYIQTWFLPSRSLSHAWMFRWNNQMKNWLTLFLHQTADNQKFQKLFLILSLHFQTHTSP